MLARVAEYAMSIEMACPCRSGTSGTSSWSGDHLFRVSSCATITPVLVLRVSICDDSIETDLVEVGCLELQHLVDTSSVDLVSSLLNLGWRSIGAAKACLDDLLAVLVEQVERRQVGTRRDLDQLGESVSDLCGREGSKEGEVEEGLDGSVVGTQSVLVVAVVDGDLDRDRCINQTDDRGGNADVVGVSSVGRTGESGTRMLV